MGKIKNENYILIQGFMVNELELKGNELIIYAIIYGFSQIDNQMYEGGLQYLAEWTNSTKQGVLKSIKSLLEKNLIGKEEYFINGVKFVKYYVKKFNGVLNKVEWGIKQSLMGGIKQSLTNNIYIDNTNNNILIYKEVVDYLNKKANKHFKYTKNNLDKIKTRFKEGFTKEDFIIVIDKKCKEWLNDEKMNCYLRPETLFGSKFESYLNQNKINNKPEWFNKEVEDTKATDEEIQEMNDLLKEFE